MNGPGLRRYALSVLGALLVVFVTLVVPGQAPLAQGRDEVIVGASEDEYDLGPNWSTFAMYPLNANVFEPLVRVTPNYSVAPGLATHWEYRGQSTWRFTLQPGVQFHDGQPLTADAVRWTMERQAKAEGGYSFIGEQSVHVIDEHTVEITPTIPNLRLLTQLVHPSYGIVAPGTEPAVRAVGTGPFKVAEYRKGDRLVVERNDAYWGTKANVRRMTFRFLPDPNTRFLALVAGQIDIMYDVPRELVGALRLRRGLGVARAPIGRTMLMYLNIHGTEPHVLLQDRALRQALGLAIDRQSLVRNVWKGNAETVQTMAPFSILGPFAHLIKGVPYAPRQAGELLDRAGWKAGPDGVRQKEGRRLSLDLIAWPEVDASTLQFVQAQLKQVGIEVRLVRAPDRPTYNNLLNNGQFDIDIEVPNQNDADPVFLPALRFYSKASGHNVKYFAPGDKFDRIIEEALQTTDRPVVQRKAAEAMSYQIDQEAVVVSLAGVYRIYGLRDVVHGFVPHPSATNQLWTSLSIVH